MSSSVGERSFLRLLGVMAVIAGICYYAWRLFGRSRLLMGFLLFLAVALVLLGRWMWRARRAALESEARRREAEFWRATLPKRAAESFDDPR